MANFQNYIEKRAGRTIEDDLLIRHKHLKRKIEALKIRRVKEETQYNQEAPTINARSKRLASKSEKKLFSSASRMENTQNILARSRFMPRNVKISLVSLEKKNSDLKFSPGKTTRYEIKVTSPRTPSPITFPSLENKGKNALPLDISMRNKLLFGLRKEISSRGFQSEPQEPESLPVHERSQIWLKNKQSRIEDSRKNKFLNETKGCTFTPALCNKTIRSANTTQRTLSAETSYSELYLRKKGYQGKKKIFSRRTESVDTKFATTEKWGQTERKFIKDYENLCPASMSVAYSTGFSNDLVKRARPMIGYTMLRLES